MGRGKWQEDPSVPQQCCIGAPESYSSAYAEVSSLEQLCSLKKGRERGGDKFLFPVLSVHGIWFLITVNLAVIYTVAALCGPTQYRVLSHYALHNHIVKDNLCPAFKT